MTDSPSSRHSATTLADRLDCDFALINRNRSKGDGPDAEGKMELLVGDVKDKVAILIDDMADTGGTIKLATQTLVEKGVKEVYALVSHGASPLPLSLSPCYVYWTLTSTSRDRSAVGREHAGARKDAHRQGRRASPSLVRLLPLHGRPLTLDRVLQVSNTINQAEHMKQAQGKLEIMDISPVLAESIRRVRPSLPLSSQSAPADCCLSRRHTTVSRSRSCSSSAGSGKGDEREDTFRRRASGRGIGEAAKQYQGLSTLSPSCDQCISFHCARQEERRELLGA